MPLDLIPTLIDKQDTFEVIRDQIALILASESASQQALATAGAKDPDLWKLNVFTEASNPWNRYQDMDDPTPTVNVWYDAGVFPGNKGDTVERQAHEATYNLDCYGAAVSASDGTGQKPGDTEAAFEAQRTVRLVRNIIMAAQNTYLQLRGTVWQRWIQSMTVFQPQLDDQAAQRVVGARIALRVTFNEFAPQYELETLEYLAVDITRTEDGLILVEADYSYIDPVFSAPFNDPADPLATLQGGPLTMSRGTGALRFDGVKFEDVGNDILRIETGVNSVNLGALVEGQRTFAELLKTDTSQDLIANWTATGIITAFEADADSYGGTRWKLAADGSDRVFVQTIAIAAAARSLAFYVRRTDGGVVDGSYCQIYREAADRTTVYTHIGGSVYKVEELNFTGSGGAADTGLKVKAGKTVQLVAPMGLEDGRFASSPIPTDTAAVTRNSDDLTFASAGIINDIEGSILAEMDIKFDGVNISRQFGFDPTTSISWFVVATKIFYNDGSGGKDTGQVIASGVPFKAGINWGGANVRAFKDGVLGNTPLAYGGSWQAGVNCMIGGTNSGVSKIFGHIKEFEVYDVQLEDNLMIADTA